MDAVHCAEGRCGGCCLWKRGRMGREEALWKCPYAAPMEDMGNWAYCDPQEPSTHALLQCVSKCSCDRSAIRSDKGGARF